MSRNKRNTNLLNDIRDNTQAAAQNTESIDSKMDSLQTDANEIKKGIKSKAGLIITIIGLVISVSGVSVWGLIKDRKPDKEIYLYAEYSKVVLNQPTNMTATLNFEADSVSITAHLGSGAEDTLEMQQKSATEWQKKVKFVETGTHTVVVTATTADGDTVENSIEVEVIPGEENILQQFLNLGE